MMSFTGVLKAEGVRRKKVKQKPMSCESGSIRVSRDTVRRLWRKHYTVDRWGLTNTLCMTRCSE